MKSLFVSLVLIAAAAQANAATLVLHCKSNPSQSNDQVEMTLSRTDSASGNVIFAVVESESGAREDFSGLHFYGKNNFGIIISYYSKGSEFGFSGSRDSNDSSQATKWYLTVPSLGLKNEPMSCN